MSSGVILLQRPYISFTSPLLLILRREITAAAVALLFIEINNNMYCVKFKDIHDSFCYFAFETLQLKSDKLSLLFLIQLLLLAGCIYELMSKGH